MEREWRSNGWKRIGLVVMPGTVQVCYSSCFFFVLEVSLPLLLVNIISIMGVCTYVSLLLLLLLWCLYPR